MKNIIDKMGREIGQSMAIAALVVGGLGGAAQAASMDEVQLLNIPDSAGRVISAFYVSGREGTMSTSGQTLKIRSIKKGPVRVTIDERGAAVLPEVQIIQSGFEVFNFLVLTIHRPEQKNVYLRNADGSFPEDPRIRNNDWSVCSESDFQVERTVFISVIRLNEIKASQGGKRPIVVDFAQNMQ